MGVLVMKIGFAQINTTVGDFSGNATRILEAYKTLSRRGADLVLTPELALTGPLPDDLVFRERFIPSGLEVLGQLAGEVDTAALLVGFSGPGGPESGGGGWANSCAVIEPGRPMRVIRQARLMPRSEEGEARRLGPISSSRVVRIGGLGVGVTIGQELSLDGDFVPEHPGETATARPDLLVNLSARPFRMGTNHSVIPLAQRLQAPVALCNAVGGNDHLVFEGRSMAATPQGGFWCARGFAEDIALVDFGALSGRPAQEDDPMQDLHDALTLGLRDYVQKSGFSTCILGLSGGVDSALVAALAVEALGAPAVTGVLLPTEFTSQQSIEDAEELAAHLGIRALTIPIQPGFEALKGQLAGVFAGRREDVTEENLQARIRGLTLMALSNKFGNLLLCTGNKSEAAVGYCTLYGDMCGGFAPISDVYKTTVYRLSHWINARAGRTLIPESTLIKPPSAELRLNQTDQDTLPPYDILDNILGLLIEENLSCESIVARGFDAGVVRWVVRQVEISEYKRRQAAPGLQVTRLAFGAGRRIPLARFIAR